MRFLAVLTVRNEAAFLLEWLAHHRAVGFTDFLVLSNDCDDGTDAMLDRLEAMGELFHIRNNGPHQGGVQWAALKLADKHALVEASDWILALDIDEFVNIHVGDHRLPDLLSALPDATAITLTWRLFGNSGVVEYRDAPITGQFTRAAPRVMYWPWRASMFKTLYRNNGIYRKLGVHRPKSPDKSRLEQARWFDGCGRELEGRFKTQQIFSPYGRDNWALAQMNHYPLGAMQSYVLKSDRGRAVHDDTLGMSYWVERNWSVETDTSISSVQTTRQSVFDGLLADGELSRLHSAAVAWRKTRFASLMAQETYRALFGRLLMTPPSTPVDLATARVLMEHAQSARRSED